jgi:hypothetical protein
MLALAARCGTLRHVAARPAGGAGGDQPTGLGDSPGSRRWEAAAIALKRAIKMSIFIARFTVSRRGPQARSTLQSNLRSNDDEMVT